MSNGDIVSLSNHQVPTIVSFDVVENKLVIGEAAKLEGLNNQTNMFNFKMILGASDSVFNDSTKFWYATSKDNKKITESAKNYSAKEVTKFFLKELLNNAITPEKLIFGIPAVRDANWRANFRRHMEEVLREIGYTDVDFFFEPFAVFQYYRHYEKKFPIVSNSEIILVIDIGGGTFNSCIIQTTLEGNLSRGGANQLPLGLQADQCGGSIVDLKMLEIVIEKAGKKGIKWKDSPTSRAKMPAMMRIEQAKIALSNSIGQEASIRGKYDHIKENIVLPKGYLHPDIAIEETLTGDDLKKIIQHMWRKHYGSIIINTVTEAEEKLNTKIKSIDRVIVAGGSAKLPFIREEIELVLRSRLIKDNIIVGDDLGNAVAYGIACECKELVKQKKYAGLSVGRIAPCLLSDLYICFRKERRGEIYFPVIGGSNTDGLLFSSPFETQGKILKYLVEIDFEANDKLYYYFTKDKVTEDDFNFINVTNHVITVPSKISKKFEIELEIKQNGTILPRFIFRGKGSDAKKQSNTIAVDEIYLDEIEVKDGDAYVGIDFGTSNSYIAKLMSYSSTERETKYPEFEINRIISENLRKTEIEINEYKKDNLLKQDLVVGHSKSRKLHMIFHSNKIEGNKLSKGETQALLESKPTEDRTVAQIEAINHEIAFDWVIDNFHGLQDEPEGFIRTINKMLLNDIEELSGSYRSGPVKISGMEYIPPPGFDVPDFMKRLGDEIKAGVSGRFAIEFAASVHTKLVMIHPFVDGNGRTARLLTNAILLLNDLPIIVINYAEKQRYFDAIIHANTGDISELVDLWIECFSQEIDLMVKDVFIDIETNTDKLEKKTNSPASVGIVGRGKKFTSIIQNKTSQLEMLKEKTFESWSSSYDELLKNIEYYANEFNSNDEIKKIGYNIKLIKYDQLTFEKYLELESGKSTPKTWYFRIDISRANKYEKIMFFFQKASQFVQSQTNANKVSLGVARYDGKQFRRVIHEPINLHELFFKNDQILGFVKQQYNISKRYFAND